MENARIIIVEDEPIISADLAMYMKKMGHKVIGKAYNSERALDIIAIHQPDLILLDVNIEGTKDGIEIAGIINDKYKFPFIFITSYSDKETLDRAKVTMPYGYIVKPFNERDIVSTVEMALFRISSEKQGAKLDKKKINDISTSNLTRKEFEILEDILEGFSNNDLASKHFLSINTIKTHVKNLYMKLDVNNRAAVITKINKL